MNKLSKKIKVAALTCLIAAAVLIGSTERGNSAYYDNYNSYYQYYIYYYYQGYGIGYAYAAYAYYYYYLAGFNGDYYAFYSDPYGYKSPNYRGYDPFWDTQWDYYANYGDYYAHL